MFAEAVTYPRSLISKPHSLRLELERLSLERGLSLNAVAESVSGAVNRHYVYGGVAFSILPVHSFRDKLLAGEVFARAVTDPAMSRTYELRWPAVRKINRASSAVATTDRTICNDLFQPLGEHAPIAVVECPRKWTSRPKIEFHCSQRQFFVSDEPLRRGNKIP